MRHLHIQAENTTTSTCLLLFVSNETFIPTATSALSQKAALKRKPIESIGALLWLSIWRASPPLVVPSARAPVADACDGTVSRPALTAPSLSPSRKPRINRTQQWWDFNALQPTLHLNQFKASSLDLFPVKMATGAGWQPPYNTSASNAKYNPSPTSTMFYGGNLTVEYTQDLHLKMSKKIAQLTKVCCCEWMT